MSRPNDSRRCFERLVSVSSRTGCTDVSVLSRYRHSPVSSRSRHSNISVLSRSRESDVSVSASYVSFTTLLVPETGTSYLVPETCMWVGSVWYKYFLVQVSCMQFSSALLQHRNCATRDTNCAVWLARELFWCKKLINLHPIFMQVSGASFLSVCHRHNSSCKLQSTITLIQSFCFVELLTHGVHYFSRFNITMLWQLETLRNQLPVTDFM